MKNKVVSKINNAVDWLDHLPMWWVGLLLLAIVFTPFILLGDGVVFGVHDQLDESIMNYLLPAKYLGQNVSVMPEMLGGVNASGMQPAAVLFVLLYRFLNPLTAFLVQYAICFVCGFIGMYLSVKEMTGSSILAVAMAGCFSMLPLAPIYGLTIYGLPLVLYAFLCLYQQKRKVVSFTLLALFGVTSHLVCTGYVVLGFWAVALLVMLCRKKHNKWLWLGFALLFGVYVVVNRKLFLELLLGGSTYMSHREEFVGYPSPFWATAKDVFLNGAQHVTSLHQYLILPIFLCVIIGFFLKKDETGKKLHLASIWGMVLLIAIALFYGFCRSLPVVEWKNSISGFLKHFQAERFYWIYPAAWYAEFALAFAVIWRKGRMLAGKLILLAVVLLPTLNLIKDNSFFYMNVNQMNNGSGITGYTTWESYYAEDLMQHLEEVIGRDMEDYRVAHLGISPAPSLVHGFYTVDGYSNNYPLEYKQRFRQVIARELDKNQETKVYFDEWGSRCYLFNGVTGTYYNLSKRAGLQYEKLDFDMKALRELGCEYLFSGGEILDAERMGLEFLGYYETEASYWGIWLYHLSEEN